MLSAETKLIAHGGFPAGNFSENTYASYVAASVYRPFAIEMDVVLHPDTKQLVCFHPTASEVHNGMYPEDLVQAQVSSLFEPATVQEVVSQVQARHFLLDFKQPSRESFRALTKVDVPLNKLIVGARTPEIFTQIRKLFPEIKILALYDGQGDRYMHFANHGGNYFRLWEKDLREDRVRRLNRAGLEVWVTPGHPATATEPRTAGSIDHAILDRISKYEPDGILVNDIRQAQAYFSPDME